MASSIAARISGWRSPTSRSRTMWTAKAPPVFGDQGAWRESVTQYPSRQCIEGLVGRGDSVAQRGIHSPCLSEDPLASGVALARAVAGRQGDRALDRKPAPVRSALSRWPGNDPSPAPSASLRVRRPPFSNPLAHPDLLGQRTLPRSVSKKTGGAIGRTRHAGFGCRRQNPRLLAPADHGAAAFRDEGAYRPAGP